VIAFEIVNHINFSDNSVTGKMPELLKVKPAGLKRTARERWTMACLAVKWLIRTQYSSPSIRFRMTLSKRYTILYERSIISRLQSQGLIDIIVQSDTDGSSRSRSSSHVTDRLHQEHYLAPSDDGYLFLSSPVTPTSHSSSTHPHFFEETAKSLRMPSDLDSLSSGSHDSKLGSTGRQRPQIIFKHSISASDLKDLDKYNRMFGTSDLLLFRVRAHLSLLQRGILPSHLRDAILNICKDNNIKILIPQTAPSKQNNSKWVFFHKREIIDVTDSIGEFYASFAFM
jgi:hypothetical protein